MGAAALEQAQFNTTDFGAGLLLYRLGQQGGKPPSCAWPKPSVAEVLASETKEPSL